MSKCLKAARLKSNDQMTISSHQHFCQIEKQIDRKTERIRDGKKLRQADRDIDK